MKFFETSKYHFFKKSTYINLRWISIIGQLISVDFVYFFLNFNLDIFLSYFKVFINKYEGIGMGLASAKISWRTIEELSPQKANSVTEPVSYLPCQLKPFLKP